VKRKDKGKDVVWNALRITIKRMECMARIGSWHNPLVMWLVEVLVDEWVMKAPVDQVDEAICECNKERELEEVVPHWNICCADIQQRVTPDFSKEERDGADGHDRESGICLGDFLSDLVLEELGVIERSLVEDEDVGKCCTNVI